MIARSGASCLVLMAGGPSLAAGAAPLPPKKPQGLSVGAPASPASRRALARAAPLPPPRPAELDAEEDDAQSPEPSPRFAARTAEPAGDAAVEEEAPLPPARQGAPVPAAEGTPAAGAFPSGAAPGMPAACAALMDDGIMLAALDAPISPRGGCGLAQPVRLSGVRLADGRLVVFKPASVTKCEVAAAVAGWLREDLAPAVATLGSEVATVTVAASYDCRSRNRISGARISEHGLGNALDVGGFELADGRVLKVEKGGLPPRLRAAMKESACRRFTTVLGPGSDGYHEDHIHVDLAQRRLDIRLCRWNLEAGTQVARKDKLKEAVRAPRAAAPKGGDPEGVEADGGEDGIPAGAGGR